MLIRCTIRTTESLFQSRTLHIDLFSIQFLRHLFLPFLHPVAQTENVMQSENNCTVHELVRATRTCRRFHEHQAIDRQTLYNLVDLARLSGSARNGQPWQYMVVTDPQLGDRIFPCLGWAGYLTEWKGPVPGERPAAYILCLLNRHWLKGSEKEAWFDLGIASQSLLLGAAKRSILGCRIGNFSKKALEMLTIPEHLSLELIIALGHPKEQIVIDEMQDEVDVRYWRDGNQLHHVPKRPLSQVLIELERLKLKAS
jgi:nitroreductase